MWVACRWLYRWVRGESCCCKAAFSPLTATPSIGCNLELLRVFLSTLSYRLSVDLFTGLHGLLGPFVCRTKLYACFPHIGRPDWQTDLPDGKSTSDGWRRFDGAEKLKRLCGLVSVKPALLLPLSEGVAIVELG